MNSHGPHDLWVGWRGGIAGEPDPGECPRCGLWVLDRPRERQAPLLGVFSPGPQSEDAVVEVGVYPVKDLLGQCVQVLAPGAVRDDPAVVRTEFNSVPVLATFGHMVAPELTVRWRSPASLGVTWHGVAQSNDATPAQP